MKQTILVVSQSHFESDIHKFRVSLLEQYVEIIISIPGETKLNLSVESKNAQMYTVYDCGWVYCVIPNSTSNT